MRGQKHFTPEQQQVIRRLYENEKLSTKQISELYNISYSGVNRLVRRAGGKIRSHSEASAVRESFEKRPPNPMAVTDIRNPLCSIMRVSPDKLKAMRIRMNMTQTTLAEKIGCPKPDLIRQWEKGERHISGDYLLRFMLVCLCRPQDLCAPQESPDDK